MRGLVLQVFIIIFVQLLQRISQLEGNLAPTQQRFYTFIIITSDFCVSDMIRMMMMTAAMVVVVYVVQCAARASIFDKFDYGHSALELGGTSG